MSIPYRMNPMGGNVEALPPSNQIWYWAPEQVTLYDSTGVVSHTFSNGKGVLTFASAVTTVGQWLRATAVTAVRVPDCVTVFGDYAFTTCTSLVSVNIPDGVTSILWRVFEGCTSLQSITIPDTVSIIQVEAFSQCSNLGKIKLPSNLTILHQSAFYFCTSLVIDEIPAGVTAIGLIAFARCYALTSIRFLGTPTSIADGAFTYDSALKDIYVPWAEGAVANAPWGATNATIHYNS